MSHYWPGQDLRDVFRPGSGLTPRKVLAFVEHLPDTSATVAQMMGGPKYRGYGIDRLLRLGLYNLWSKEPFPSPDGDPRVLSLDDY